jgi:hypothetical protein
MLWIGVIKIVQEGEMAEKRKDPRCSTGITVMDEATLRIRHTKNISLGGCLIKKANKFDFFPIGYQLSLNFILPGLDETLAVRGTVRHRGDHAEELGIQFKAVDKKSAYYLERLTGTFL